jgi:penicillin-binding protein 2
MRVSCAGTVALLFAVFGTLSVAALDVPQTLHHSKTSQHLKQTRSTSSRRAAAKTRAAKKAAASKAAASKTTKKSATSTSSRTRKAGSANKATKAARATAKTARAGAKRATLKGRRRRSYERFTASSFASGIGDGDIVTGEDPAVRQAAIDALGDMNGTAVVIDPSNGRVLAMVNQKLALSPGAEPCSTIKLTVALAALQEGLVTKDTMVRLSGFKMNMTQALAKSNNLYFEELGRELGFERVRRYATEFGLGELAGYNIAGEQLGVYPDEVLPASEGGVGRMCSFGQGISLTPLQLGAFVAAIANGGTLYYLQHPETAEEIANFEPKVKRTLGIAPYVADMEDGMAGAVEYGTARRLRANFSQMQVFGKTGTCSDKGTRFGWFASYSPEANLVTVFFLEGGRPTFGPRAAELTGEFYANLWDRSYFVSKEREAKAMSPVAVPATANHGVVQ